jgi:hypothetical protein
MTAKFAFQFKRPVSLLPTLFVHQVSTPLAPSKTPFEGKISEFKLATGALELFYHVPKSIIDIASALHSRMMPQNGNAWQRIFATSLVK